MTHGETTLLRQPRKSQVTAEVLIQQFTSATSLPGSKSSTMNGGGDLDRVVGIHQAAAQHQHEVVKKQIAHLRVRSKLVQDHLRQMVEHGIRCALVTHKRVDFSHSDVLG